MFESETRNVSLRIRGREREREAYRRGVDDKSDERVGGIIYENFLLPLLARRHNFDLGIPQLPSHSSYTRARCVTLALESQSREIYRDVFPVKLLLLYCPYL